DRGGGGGLRRGADGGGGTAAPRATARSARSGPPTGERGRRDPAQRAPALVGGVWAEVKTVAIGTVRQEAASGAIHTGDLSYFSRRADHTTFTHLALCETHRRGVASAGIVVGVMDGSPWL